MVNCAVPSCKNDSRRQTKQNSNVTFHRFPRNEELLKKWVSAVKRADWQPTIRSFVCSAHFPEPCMYLSRSGLRKLHPHAVPQLLIHDQPRTPSRRKTKHNTKPNKSYTTERNTFHLDKVKKEREPRADADANTKLKKRIINLTKLSKRRRLRCNALYASLNRIRKKVRSAAAALSALQGGAAHSAALGRLLEEHGVAPAELLRGLGNRDRSPSPEGHHDEFLYAEIPLELARTPSPPARPLTVRSTSYPPLPPHSPPAAELPVKTEQASPAPPELGEVPEPVFVDTAASCHVCLQSSAPPVAPLEPAHRPLYQLLAQTELAECDSVRLCRECRALLRHCHIFTELARSAETFHTQGAVSEIKMAEEL